MNMYWDGISGSLSVLSMVYSILIDSAFWFGSGKKLLVYNND